MTDDDGEPRVPVVCEECGTRARLPLEEAADTVEAHNERHHGGEGVAGVDPAVADRIADLAAEDLGLLD
ncbi:MAG: hypothetical protein ABEH77_07950 [Halobacteriaceae archaeon]